MMLPWQSSRSWRSRRRMLSEVAGFAMACWFVGWGTEFDHFYYDIFLLVWQASLRARLMDVLLFFSPFFSALDSGYQYEVITIRSMLPINMTSFPIYPSPSHLPTYIPFVLHEAKGSSSKYHNLRKISCSVHAGYPSLPYLLDEFHVESHFLLGFPKAGRE